MTIKEYLENNKRDIDNNCIIIKNIKFFVYDIDMADKHDINEKFPVHLNKDTVKELSFIDRVNMLEEMITPHLNKIEDPTIDSVLAYFKSKTDDDDHIYWDRIFYIRTRDDFDYEHYGYLKDKILVGIRVGTI